jgi:hypothetical protein
VTATRDWPDRGLDTATLHNLPRPRPATVRVAHRDAEPRGGLYATATEKARCLSHAAAALRRIDQLAIMAATDEEVRRLAAARNRPVAVDPTQRSVRNLRPRTAPDRS